MSRWLPDVGFTGGATDVLDVEQIVRAAENGAPLGVLRDVRSGMTSYVRNLTANTYTLRLHFIDPTSGTNGERVQSVAVNGATLIAALDIYDETNAPYTELVKEVTFTHQGGDCTVAFTASVGTTGPLAGIAFIPSNTSTTPPPTPPPEPPSGAWVYELFPNTVLQAPATVVGAEDTIQHQWLSEAPAVGFQADNWSGRWTGTHSFDAGDYEFHARADDRVRIRLREAGTTDPYTLVLEYWGDSAPPTDYYSTSLHPAGVSLDGDYEVIVEFVEFQGWAVLEVEWYLAEPLSGVHTFTDSDGSELPAPWTKHEVHATETDTAIHGNRMRLRVTANGSDRSAIGILPAAYANYRVTGQIEFSATDVYSGSVLMRHTGTDTYTFPYTTSTVEAYIFELRPKLGQLGFGRRIGNSGSNNEYSELSFTTFAFQANVTYNFRYEVHGNDLRLWVGTGTFAGVWSHQYTDSSGAVDSPGETVEFWHGDHGYNSSGTRDVFFDNIVVEDLGVPGGGGGPTSPGALLHGVFTGHSASHNVQFGVDVGAAVEASLVYLPTQGSLAANASGAPAYIFGPQTATEGGFTQWLQGDANRRLILSVPLLTTNEPGQFYNTALDTYHVQIAQWVNALPVNDNQIILRPGWEMNGDWNPGGRQFDIAAGRPYGTGFKDMWRRVIPQYRANCDSLISWCPVITSQGLWDPGCYLHYWPGDDPAYRPDIAAFDIYARWGAENLTWPEEFAQFAVAHGVNCGIEELGLDDQTGDLAWWLQGVLDIAAAYDFTYVCYFEFRDATELRLRSGSVPNSRAVWEAFWQS